MIANLGFTYPEEGAEFDWPAQKSEPRPAGVSEAYDLPSQMEFQLAAPPQLLHESPAPLQFSRLKEATKIIPRKSRSKPELYPATVKVKYAGFSGIPSKSLQKLAMLRKQAKRAKQQSKPSPPHKSDWNEDVKTTGLFDPKLTKKLPVKVLHQAKSQGRPSSAHAPKASTKPTPKDTAKDSKPKIFREWTEMIKAEAVPGEEKSESNRRTTPLKDNLDFKFVADQEALVERLEKQLAQEQSARRALDRQFAERMKELEKLKGMDKRIETAKKQYMERKGEKRVTIVEEEKKKTEAKPAPPAKASLRPAVLSPTVSLPRPMTSSQLQSQIEVTKESLSDRSPPGDIIDYPVEEIRPDLRFGDIHEEPTRDRTPPPRAAAAKAAVKPAVFHPVFPAEAVISEVRDAIRGRPEASLMQKLAAARPPAVQDLPRNVKKEAFLSSLANKVDLAEKYGAGDRTIGIVSKVSSKYIAYYADDLADLFIEDLLADTVMDLQRIEERIVVRTQSQIRNEAGAMLDSLVSEFTDRVKVVQGKWVDRPKSLPVAELVCDSRPGIVLEDRRRLWEVNIEDRDLRRIRDGKREYEEFVKRQTGGSKMWDIYARVGDQLLAEVLEEALADFDAALGDFTEHIISSELS